MNDDEDEYESDFDFIAPKKLPNFSAPAIAKIGDYFYFLVRRGRIPANRLLRQGGVWQPVIDGRTKLEHISVSCPRHACKAIIDVEPWLFERNITLFNNIKIAMQDSGTCVVCNRCGTHHWFALEGWMDKDRFRKAIR